MGRFDTVGIDCVANNVNDLLCLGAESIALLDYIAVSAIDEQQIEQIAEGLAVGAARAHISIPGGEIAQVRDMLMTKRKILYRLDCFFTVNLQISS